MENKPDYLKAKEQEIDRAIEAKKRELLADIVGKSVSFELEPTLNKINSTLESKDNKDIIDKLEEVKELLKAEIIIEI